MIFFYTIDVKMLTFLLTAPHPDDDICGLFDRLQHLKNYNVIVWFMTNGENEERKREGESALNVINIKQIVWRTLPFYNRADRSVANDDILVAREILAAYTPDEIAICYDVDPNKTHTKCAYILQQARHFLPMKCWLYQSVWGSTSVVSSSLDKPITWKVQDPALKREALQCHKSQLKLKVHDGHGDNLLLRGNIETETFWVVSYKKFCAVSLPLPSLYRRTTKVNCLSTYIFEKYITKLQEGSRVIFPTGNTPKDLYKLMRSKQIPALHVFQLDEYENSTEYRDFLINELPTNMVFHFINNDIEKHDEACTTGGIDVCFLGVGQNGHIGFNEPGSTIYSPSRLVKLTKSTIDANKTKYTHAKTLGVQTIMKSKKIVLMAKRNKYDILQRVYQNETPAAFLRFHPNVEIVIE